MSKFNFPQPSRVQTPYSPPSLYATGGTIQAAAQPVMVIPSDTTTYNGAAGWTRTPKGELYLLAVSNLLSKTYYEGAEARDERFRELVRKVAVEDPAWTLDFVRWLRDGGNIRSAALVAGIEAARVQKNAPGGGLGARRFVDAVLLRADEPGEALAYCKSRGYKVSGGVKRGIADAAVRLYNQHSLLKYDGQSKDFRFGDVIELVHPEPKDDTQSALFKHAIDRRHKREEVIPVALKTLCLNLEVNAIPVEERRKTVEQGYFNSPVFGSYTLQDAGMTWERIASWIQGPMDKLLWEAAIPGMGGGMALSRNLRNFDQAGVSDAVARYVGDKISDPEQVAKSRQFPFRYLSAYKAAPSLRWAWPLEQALNASLSNVPTLAGHSLILVDRSPSMWWTKLSEHSDMDWADAAALFGAALAKRAASADLVEFGAANSRVDFKAEESILKIMERFGRGDGTDIPRAVYDNFRKGVHSRVIIITDEQSSPGVLPSNVWGHPQYPGSHQETKVRDLVPVEVPVYLWNFAGYRAGVAPSGWDNVHSFGGLTDASFSQIQLIESGAAGVWPWQQ